MFVVLNEGRVRRRGRVLLFITEWDKFAVAHRPCKCDKVLTNSTLLLSFAKERVSKAEKDK